MSKYRHLENGEIIQEGDESDSAPDGYNDSPRWIPIHPGNVGGLAPDPQYPSHRQYRRAIERNVSQRLTDMLLEIAVDSEPQPLKTAKAIGELASAIMELDCRILELELANAQPQGE